MQTQFWLERWEEDQIGFHQSVHNSLLTEFWQRLQIAPGADVFVPLCGKSLDMRWLVEAGHPLLGVELSRIAVEGFFAEQQVSIDQIDRFRRYRAEQLCLYEGDFFDLTALEIPRSTRGVFDRAGLIALPPLMREHYVDHMLRILPEQTRILLLTLEYDQSKLPGPPHAVHGEEVQTLYQDRCDIELVDTFVTSDLPPRFAKQGVREAAESVYLITKQE